MRTNSIPVLKACSSALLLTFALTDPAKAADEDIQAWAAATATISVSPKTVVWLEAQGRFFNDVSRTGQVLLRPGIGFKLNPTTTVFGGYAYIYSNPQGAASTREHRIWQQLSFRAAGNGKGLTLTGRSRFEQRLLEGSGDVGLRFRQLLRLTAPLSGKVRAVGWSEVFMALNDTSWGQRGGLDRVRNFAGIAVPLTKALVVEPGYMNEYINRRGQDRVNHIMSVTLNANF